MPRLNAAMRKSGFTKRAERVLAEFYDFRIAWKFRFRCAISISKTSLGLRL